MQSRKRNLKNNKSCKPTKSNHEPAFANNNKKVLIWVVDSSTWFSTDLSKEADFHKIVGNYNWIISGVTKIVPTSRFFILQRNRQRDKGSSTIFKNRQKRNIVCFRGVCQSMIFKSSPVRFSPFGGFPYMDLIETWQINALLCKLICVKNEVIWLKNEGDIAILQKNPWTNH